ncbi:MAG: class I SAM-dependent RNA methyltransferase [Deltaproteobacteria bacterium]|nr:class I SAM-dependent RNA methyltransferase [Deltaproteobacteria bacterium]
MTDFQRAAPLVIPCARGIVPFLQVELRDLGLPVTAAGAASVSSRGTLVDAMRLNLHCRTGQHVYYQLDDFPAADQQELYRRLVAFPWEKYFSPDVYLSVSSTVNNPTIRDGRLANLKAKDAIVDRLRRHYGRRPDSGPGRHGVVVHLYWQGRRCHLYLDTSGESLARRGYRLEGGRAPLQETLAAAIALAAGWDGRGALVNPMCGSGTLIIEAAMLARRQAPGLGRRHFAFMHLRGFPRRQWRQLREEARRRRLARLPGRLLASDLEAAAVDRARHNAARAGLEELVEFAVADFAATEVPPTGGVLLVNPEYGERLGEVEALRATYRRLGDFFKQRCPGYRAYLLTGSRELAKEVGLRASRRLPLFNGPLECRLLEYELYRGSRRQ